MRMLHPFGHIARADPSQDHLCALWMAINHLEADWHQTGWEVNPDEPGFGFTLHNSTFSRTALVSTQHGIKHRTVRNGDKLYRQLCPVRCMLSDNDNTAQLNRLSTCHTYCCHFGGQIHYKWQGCTEYHTAEITGQFPRHFGCCWIAEAGQIAGAKQSSCLQYNSTVQVLQPRLKLSFTSNTDAYYDEDKQSKHTNTVS